MLGSNVRMIQGFRFLPGKSQDFFYPRRVGNVADHFRLRTGPDLLFHFHADGLEIEPHLLQDVDGNALPELDQAEQQMLGPDVIVIEPIGFLSRKLQNLLGARGKIIHASLARNSRRSAPAPLYSYQVWETFSNVRG